MHSGLYDAQKLGLNENPTLTIPNQIASQCKAIILITNLHN